MSSLKSCSKGFRVSPRILLQVFPIKVWLQAVPPKSDSKDFHRNLAPRVSHEVWLQGFDPKSCSKNYPLKSCSKGVPRSLAARVTPEVLLQGLPPKSCSKHFPSSLVSMVSPTFGLRGFPPKCCSKGSPDVLEHPPKLKHVVDGTVFILTRVCFSKMFGTLSVSKHAVCVYWHECLFCRTYMLSFTNESFPNITSCISASPTIDSERDIC